MNVDLFTIRARAARDLSGQAAWLREQADVETAERFLEAAFASFAVIANTPGIGQAAESKVHGLASARKWRVDCFPDHLIFYAPRPRGGVTILRVLHAATDWKRR